MNERHTTRISFAFLACLFSTMPAMAGELVSWSNTVTSAFEAHQCVTIPGTPGTPKKCSPSYTTHYPCPSFSHPKKTCKHTVAGPCTPATPGTPDVHQCATVNLGTFSIAVDGGVYAAFDGISDSEVAVQTTANVSLFGKSGAIPVTCKVAIGKKAEICLNLLTRTFSGQGFSCEIGGAKVAAVTYPGVDASLCMDVTVGGAAGKPEGSITARIEAGVQFGSANIGGHSVSMGSKSWAPALFSMTF